MPLECLPEVGDCAGDFGHTEPRLFGDFLPIRGVAGDQQAALVGQVGIVPGEVKCTYGTGAYRVKGRTSYALEASILSVRARIEWLRDGLGLFARTAEIEALAGSVSDAGGVYLVPSFTGLGAPWDPAMTADRVQPAVLKVDGGMA